MPKINLPNKTNLISKRNINRLFMNYFNCLYCGKFLPNDSKKIIKLDEYEQWNYTKAAMDFILELAHKKCHAKFLKEKK